MKTVILWIAICSSPTQESCTVATFFKSSSPTAVAECKAEEKKAVEMLTATGVTFRHKCATLEEFEKEGL